MKSINLLIVLILLSFTSKTVAQDPRLIEAAKKEGGKAVIYGSPETPVVDAVIQAFQKKTGLAADYWRSFGHERDEPGHERISRGKCAL
jgi:hypothetical protein